MRTIIDEGDGRTYLVVDVSAWVRRLWWLTVRKSYRYACAWFELKRAK